MNAHKSAAGPDVRIDAKEFKRRMESGEPVVVLDVRGQHAWDASSQKVRGATRVLGPVTTHPTWPKDRLIVSYCT